LFALVFKVSLFLTLLGRESARQKALVVAQNKTDKRTGHAFFSKNGLFEKIPSF
jgi:hypothetical protein